MPLTQQQTGCGVAVQVRDVANWANLAVAGAASQLHSGGEFSKAFVVVAITTDTPKHDCCLCVLDLGKL